MRSCHAWFSSLDQAFFLLANLIKQNACWFVIRFCGTSFPCIAHCNMLFFNCLPFIAYNFNVSLKVIGLPLSLNWSSNAWLICGTVFHIFVSSFFELVRQRLTNLVIHRFWFLSSRCAVYNSPTSCWRIITISCLHLILLPTWGFLLSPLELATFPLL